ncbi:flagellar filament capping protein FliD [Paenibacillus polygoni]|uniref:Flagellar hook-associated protein 2 n=1 Tax=Paenibacillus polygoni TaxID=3050112 RepID=A0ABY8X0F9_9BACL|nr:flagellar filament capping protein FliD [Paenibacillus polygoni]WIV18890.1 flagellar filament capping protein FliD [Paenibacillus polygoni]
MRITGFSGMDVDSLVSSLMTAQRVPLDKLNQQKQLLQWTRDSYREINSQIINFRTKLSSFTQSAAMNTNQSTVTGNITAVKADPSASALLSNMTVEVAQLATKSAVQSPTMLVLADRKTNAIATNTLAEISGDTSKKFELNINNTTITFDGADSINTVVAKINASTANVTATFDEISGKFSISAKEYGSSNDLKFTGTEKIEKDSTLLDLFGIRADSPSGDFKKAQDGMVKVTSNGASREFTTSNNTVTVNGVQLTLLQENKGNPTTVTTQPSPDKALETIKTFVDLYNSLLDTLNTRTKETRYRDYTPLTDEQKSEMKESEIELWEEKAKSGLHKNDGILTSAISSMRSVIYSALGDLSSVGIATGQYYENGKLYINEDKLKAALNTDPQKVMDLFQGSSSSSKSGIFKSLNNQLNNTLDMLVSKAGTSKFDASVNSIFKEESSMGNQLKNYNKQIEALQSRLDDMETRYYKQFSAMETAMNKYNAQSSSLSSYFS